jgi:hypothetical protein
MIDPLLLKMIELGFAVLFIGAACHKLSNIGRFETALRDYQLLPAFVSRAIAFLIPVVEFVLGLGWIWGSLNQVTAATSAALLATYALAMTINIVRGRVYIDCGCGFGAASESEQPLSYGLVARNTLLIGLLGLTFVPVTERQLGGMDYLVVIAGLLTALLLYAGSGQLIKNRAAINTWRKK